MPSSTLAGMPHSSEQRGCSDVDWNDGNMVVLFWRAQDNGFREGDHVRRIPFEVMVRGDKQPFYEETLEVRAMDVPSLISAAVHLLVSANFPFVVGKLNIFQPSNAHSL